MIAYGKQLFWYLEERHKGVFEEIYLTSELPKDEFKKVSSLGCKIIRVDEKKAQAMAKGGAHQGILAKVVAPGILPLKELMKNDFLLVLVGVTDMGNVGQLIRTAYALGIGGIVLSGAKSFDIEKAAKPSSGAVFDMNIAIEPNPLDLLNDLKTSGYKIYGATMDGKDIKTLGFSGKRVLVLGSEHDGLSAKVSAKCEEKITIKMECGFDSLNVSAAGAILMDRMRA